MARHEVVKKVWAIIKERNLYDPKNKQFAICDDELLKVFGELLLHFDSRRLSFSFCTSMW
jgi:chromatin remodeling complex protein RSC6